MNNKKDTKQPIKMDFVSTDSDGHISVAGLVEAQDAFRKQLNTEGVKFDSWVSGGEERRNILGPDGKKVAECEIIGDSKLSAAAKQAAQIVAGGLLVAVNLPNMFDPNATPKDYIGTDLGNGLVVDPISCKSTEGIELKGLTVTRPNASKAPKAP